MKKIVPIVVAIAVIFGSFYLLNLNKPSLISYSSTNPQKYTTSPSPTGTNLKNYNNEKYNFSIQYPDKGLSPQDEFVDCGNYINSSNHTIMAPNESIILDNIATIEVVNWNKSIEDYIDSLNAKGLYNTSPIMASNADDAIRIEGLKNTWNGFGLAPLGYISDIYQKDSHLFLVQYPQDYINSGCINPSLVNDSAPFPIDRSWKIEDYLRFN